MRLVTGLLALGLIGCAHKGPTRPSGPTLELALDSGAPSERPLTPDKTFETLMRFDPQVASYRPYQLRMLVAQAGVFTFTVYDNAEDRPGTALLTIDRSYPPAYCSDGKDGKWVIEDLSTIPAQKGPLWVGISSRGGGGDPRLWATSNDSGAVFARDADPSTPLSAGRVPRTPILRVELSLTP